MILGSSCLAAAALDGQAIAAALSRLSLPKVLLRASEGLSPSGLAGLPVAGVRCTLADSRLGMAAAREGRAPLLAVDLPPDLDLLPACRGLFELSRQTPGLGLAVTTPCSGPLASPEPLALLLEDLSAERLGFWHVPSRVALAGQDDVDWYEQLGGFLWGLSLDDVSAGAGGLPPGLGQLDLARLAELTGRGVEATLDPDPVPDPALLASAVATLKAAGFR